jgi:hypothetical protein
VRPRPRPESPEHRPRLPAIIRSRSASGPDGMIYAERPRPCQLWAAPGAPRSQSLASGRRRPRQWRRLCLLGGRYDVSPDPVRRPSLSDHYGLDFKDGAKLFRAEVSGIGTAILGLGRRCTDGDFGRHKASRGTSKSGSRMCPRPTQWGQTSGCFRRMSAHSSPPYQLIASFRKFSSAWVIRRLRR